MKKLPAFAVHPKVYSGSISTGSAHCCVFSVCIVLSHSTLHCWPCLCVCVASALRSADPGLHRQRQREAVVADRRHGSVTPTGGRGWGGGCHAPPGGCRGANLYSWHCSCPACGLCGRYNNDVSTLVGGLLCLQGHHRRRRESSTLSVRRRLDSV